MKINAMNYNTITRPAFRSSATQDNQVKKLAENYATDSIRICTIIPPEIYSQQNLNGSVIYNNILISLKEKKENPRFACKKLETAEQILLDNKIEIQNALEYSYQKLNSRHRYKPSNFDYSNWTPTKPLDEANKYVFGTEAGRMEYYRGSRNPELAKQKGYSLDRVNHEYPGIYVSSDYGTACEYGSKPLELRVRANNIVALDGPFGFENELFTNLASKISDFSVLNSLKDINGIVELEMGKKLNIDAFFRRVQPFPEDEPTNALAVLNPKNIVIVE